MKAASAPFLHLAWLIAVTIATDARLQAAEAPTRRQWTVDGVTREALVCMPASAKTKPAPVIFAFHGHGGTMAHAMRTFGYHTLWPEAIVIYPQGLNTPGRLTDPQGKRPGWQHGLGDQGDRDLKFFDAMLASLKNEFQVDGKRLYATGHSNGGGFSYLLWAARGEQFAAFAPSAAAAPTLLRHLKPKPVLHVAGEKDPLVKYTWQSATIAALRGINQCSEGQAWELDKDCTLYPSVSGAPVVTAIHPGDHQFPKQAPGVIVKFFKSQVKP